MKHITEANKFPKQLKRLPSTLKYRKGYISGKVGGETFSDTSFHLISGLEYGQTGVITGIAIESPIGNSTT